MEDTEKIQMGDTSFRLAKTPRELLDSGHAEWGLRDMIDGDLEEGLARGWANCVGLLFDGGAVLLIDMNDGVWRMVANLATKGDADRRTIAEVGTSIAYAFTATNCMRITTAIRKEGAQLAAEVFGLHPCAARVVTDVNGEPCEFVELAANLDEWLELFGPRMFHVEATRLDNTAKADRAMTRWTLTHGDDPLDVSDAGAGFGVDGLVSAARGNAVAAGFAWAADAGQTWLEHAEDCKFGPRGYCSCIPQVGFKSDAEVIRVDIYGDVSRHQVN